MRNIKIQGVIIMSTIIFLLCISSLNASPEYVQGFSGIPVYPGADTRVDRKRSGETDEDGNFWIWYEFKNKKLRDEWNKDSVKVMKKIIHFYKTKLAKSGWQYIGEGVQRHHWVKEKKGIAIGFADYAITYASMSNWDARTNVVKLSEKEFMRVYVDCAKAVQKIYEKQGITSGDEYARRMLEMSKKNPMEFTKEDKTKIEVKKTIKNKLRSFRISLGRFRELKSKYGNALQKYITNNTNEYMRNQMGFLAIDQMDTSDSIPNIPYETLMPQMNKMSR